MSAMPRSRYHNCFYYFRGPEAKKEAALDRQLEDNATKALINVLDHGDPSLTETFVAEVVGAPEHSGAGRFEYFIQQGPGNPAERRILLGLSLLGEVDPATWPQADRMDGGSRVDAAIHAAGALTVLVETKVVERLDGAQLVRHAEKWQLPRALPGPDRSWTLPDQWVLTTWTTVYMWARAQRGGRHGEPTEFLLQQFTEFLELAGLAPAWSFRNEHFEYFAKPPEDRDPILNGEIRTRLGSLWGRVEESIGERAFKEVLGVVRVGHVAQDHAWAQSNADQGSDYVNLTIELWKDEVCVNVVGWFDRQREAVLRWLGSENRARFVEAHPDHEIVAFAREGIPHKSGDGFVFQGAKGRVLGRLGFANRNQDAVLRSLDKKRAALKPVGEKLGLHLRRAWPREVAVEIDDLAEPLAAEIRALIPVLGEIRGG